MTVRELLNVLGSHIPMHLAMGFDNVGLLVGRSDKKVQKIYLAVDATMDVVDAAIREDADVILTHHPLIFSGMKQIVDEDITGRRILKLIEHNIALIAMHTNYDIAKGCMTDAVSQRLGLSGEVLEVMNEMEIDGEVVRLGIGTVYDVDISLKDLVKEVKERFALDFVRVYGSDLIQENLKRIAVSAGSGKGMYKEAVKKKAEVLITGDITHHEGIDAREAGICIIDAGHFGIEKVFLEDMEDKLKLWLPEQGIHITSHNEKSPDELW